MRIAVTCGRLTVVFQFRAGSLWFSRFKNVGESHQIEIKLDGEGRMFFVFDGHQLRLLEDVVRALFGRHLSRYCFRSEAVHDARVPLSFV